MTKDEFEDAKTLWKIINAYHCFRNVEISKSGKFICGNATYRPADQADTPVGVRFRRSARCGERMASLTAIMKQSFINKGVPEAWERENE